jgi:hypothetical protein
MKKILTTTLLAIFCLSLNAQIPDWQWVESAGGTGSDSGIAISTDINGNVYVTGYFNSPSITFGTTTLTNAGSTNFFIVKFNPSGDVLWAKSAGGTDSDYSRSISVDANENVYMTGFFDSPSITFGTTTLTNVGYRDIFVVKYSLNGDVLWAKSAGGTKDDKSSSISIDAIGNVVITGEFSSSSITFETTTLSNTNTYRDIFIAKYDPNGSLLWAISTGGIKDDYSSGITTDANGNFYVCGSFESMSITFGTTILTNVGDMDMYVVKYDPNGNALWAKPCGGSDWDYCRSISVDANANIFITGEFGSQSCTFGTFILSCTGIYDIFVVKYNPNGDVLWAKSAGVTNFQSGNSISTDANGNVYITGYFDSPSITFGTTTLSNAGLYDIFVVKYNSNGNVVWAKSAGGTDLDTGTGISNNSDADVYVTGGFSSPTISFGSFILTTAGQMDIFATKLNGTTGITAQNKSDFGMNISPNPFTNYAYLESDIYLTDAILLIYDIHGQKVKQMINISGKTFPIYRGNLHDGIYFVRVVEKNIVIGSCRMVILD